MIETRIELPDAPADVLKRVEAADAMLHERAENAQGLKFFGVWTADGSAPLTEQVRLTVRLGQDEFSRSITRTELTDPRNARDAVRDAVWGVTRESSHRSARELLRVVAEIKADAASELESVGR
jgi:hypothetical protein